MFIRASCGREPHEPTKSSSSLARRAAVARLVASRRSFQARNGTLVAFTLFHYNGNALNPRIPEQSDTRSATFIRSGRRSVDSRPAFGGGEAMRIQDADLRPRSAVAVGEAYGRPIRREARLDDQLIPSRLRPRIHSRPAWYIQPDAPVYHVHPALPP